tara:strand:+ start:492 stop:935 length:444 start_codon:yes stop_codon:yes gene_type:complete
MPKPSSEWLVEDLSFLQSDGFDVIVSLLESEEILELGLTDEPEACADLGLNFILLAIRDRGIPTEADAFHNLIMDLRSRYDSGQSIAIHCRAGIGRSGMVAAAFLMSLGHSLDGAVGILTKARGVDVPDTPVQLDFLDTMSTRLLAG